MTEQEVLKIFKDTGAMLTGHFKLSSGLHSGQYLQCAIVLQYPDIASQLAREIAKKFQGARVSVVIGPAVGGITIAYEVARHLKAKALFAERENGAMTLRRGFKIGKRDRVLVVEDVITTGGSVKEVIKMAEEIGASVTGLGCIIDRSDSAVEFGAKLVSLAKVKIKTYNEAECPLCRQGVKLVKPGSKKH